MSEHDDNQKGDVQAAIDVAIERATPHEVNFGNGLVMHKDQVYKDISPPAEHPERINQIVDLTDTQSFIDYVSRFAQPGCSVFVTHGLGRDTPQIEAVMDYHHAVPAWCGHRAKLQLIKTPEWQAWLAADGKAKDQESFGQFIEDMAPDIVEPAGATMLEIALNLSANTKVAFRSSKRLNSGQVELTYEETIDAKAGEKGKLAIPEIVKFGVALYRGFPKYQMEARFRYRMRDGNLSMWFDLVRPSRVVDDQVVSIIDELRENLPDEIAIYNGSA